MRSTKKPSRKNRATENVEVFCRIRPIDSNADTCVKKVSDNTLALTNIDSKSGLVLKETRYSFQKVFYEETTQAEVFDRIGFPLIDNLLRGKNGLLFAYGVTSSGKTHTMQGTSRNRGILHRCLDVLFSSIRPVQAKKYVFKPDKINGFDVNTEADALLERQDKEITPRLLGHKNKRLSSSTPNLSSENSSPKVNDIDYDSFYGVFVTYVEIYNNYVYDLLEELPLDPVTGYKSPTSKNIKTDQTDRMYVSDAVEVEVSSAEDAIGIFKKGQKRRKVAATALNSESSRSHSVFTIRLVQGPLDAQGEHVLMDKKKLMVSQLSLVDLAGSERTGRTGSAGDRLKEAGNINQSLMVLRSCIEALRENQKNGYKKLPPYRDSRITLLFKSYFEGEGKVSMVVCVNPLAVEYDETLNVMKFAEMAQEVQIAKAQTTRQDLGFTPGRRQAFLKPLAELTNHKSLVYNLGPPFPSLVLTSASDDKTPNELLKYLRDRQTTRISLISHFTNLQDTFRSRLVWMEKELELHKEKVFKLEKQCREKENALEDFGKRELEKDQLIEQMKWEKKIYENEREEFQKEVGEKDWAIIQEKWRNSKLRQDYNAKLDLNAKQYSQNMEQAKRKLKEEANMKLRCKQHKLDQLKIIINDSNPPTPVSNTPRSSGRFTRQTVTTTPFKVPSQPVLTVKKRTRSPPPVKPKPISSRRKSKSTEQLWVNHQPDQYDAVASILQPKLKSLKPVHKITEKELKDKEANKYLLTSQGYDSEGDFATKFVKGDVKRSIGGGTQVVFTDVEVVKNTTPGTTKRKSASPPPSDGQWTDVETRCQVALDGHAIDNKRFKSSQL